MKLSCTFLTVGLGLALLSCKPTTDHHSIEFIASVDQIMQDWESGEPGGAIAVIEKGKVIYEQYFGLADQEKGLPFSSQTQTDIGSISKQFTACLIALLEEQAKLSIEDDIRKHLPELPIYQDTIRIKHLIHHTSGIRDYEALEMLNGRHYFDDHMSNPYVVELIARQRSLNFQPSSRYEYSNSNYILLAEIIERVSNRSLNEVATSYIFEPLGMDHTFFHINQGEDFENKAIGYTEKEGELIRPKYQSHLIGDGGIYTTLSDLIKWDQNFGSNKLGKGQADLLDRMKYREPLANGHPNFMAFAQIFTTHPFGAESWSHGG
nr:beta-lactamase family protein [Saprospiraceae bacterium]